MMKVLFDTRSLQPAYHFGKLHVSEEKKISKDVENSISRRLLSFLEIIESIKSFEIMMSPGILGELQFNCLKDVGILVIMTRLFFLSQEELQDIELFVKKGGNILLMSNHPPFNEFDNPLAEKFGFTFESPTYPWHRGMHSLTTINANNLSKHPITKNLNKGIVFNNSCRIRLLEDKGINIIAKLPEENNVNNIFAIAIDKPFGCDSGRVVGLADSGFIGNDDTNVPGPGQIGKGDNKKFIYNIFNWFLQR